MASTNNTNPYMIPTNNTNNTDSDSVYMMRMDMEMRMIMRRLPNDGARRDYVRLAQTEDLLALHRRLQAGYQPGSMEVDLRCWRIVVEELAMRGVQTRTLFGEEAARTAEAELLAMPMDAEGLREILVNVVERHIRRNE